MTTAGNSNAVLVAGLAGLGLLFFAMKRKKRADDIAAGPILAGGTFVDKSLNKAVAEAAGGGLQIALCSNSLTSWFSDCDAVDAAQAEAREQAAFITATTDAGNARVAALQALPPNTPLQIVRYDGTRASTTAGTLILDWKAYLRDWLAGGKVFPPEADAERQAKISAAIARNAAVAWTRIGAPPGLAPPA